MKKTILETATESAVENGNLKPPTNDSRKKNAMARNVDGVCNAMHSMLISIQRGEWDLALLTSYDRDSREGVERLEKHTCDNEENGVSFIGKILHIAYFTLSATEFANDEGQLHLTPILTIETVRGDIVNLFSAPVLRCFMGRLRTHLLDGPLSSEHPIELELVCRQTKGERRMYWFNRPE